MHSVCFNQLKIALIGFVLLLSLTACKNSQDSMAGKETESNTEKIIQLAQTETTAKSDSETERAVFKPTVPEDDKYYYMIVDSYLVRIGKENQQMELLCFDSNCTHPRTEQCKAYIPQLTEYTVEDRGLLWLEGEELFFVSSIGKTLGSGENTREIIQKYNLVTKERGEANKLAQMEIYELPNMGWSLSGEELYYFTEQKSNHNGVENVEYRLGSRALGPNLDPPILIKTESAGERLEVQNDKIYYITQGKFYIFSMENGENILVDEDVYDFVVGEDKVFYMKSKAGIYCYEYVTGVHECIYSKYLIGNTNNPVIWLIKYSADGIQEYSIALQ